jgi:hypothetical protein
MTATVRFNLNNPQAVSLLSYIETLPFAEVKRNRTPSNTSVKQAVGKGVVSLDEFDVRFKETITKVYGV